MCGICGVISTLEREPVSEATLLRMRDAMVHRGPDDGGHYLAPGIALGSRRLAIQDLSEHGHMPMSTPDGRYWIVYNGEAYNFRELRPRLEARGYQFRSDSDTEVLLYLYADEGPAMLERLNGMFAIAIWDTRERTLFLARDRVGVKPLYYTQQGESLYFASEEKVLFAAGVRPEFDTSTWEEMLCFRFVSGETTPFAGVKRLLPGHYMLWRQGDVTIRRWWNLGDRARELREQAPTQASDWFRETFDSSVSLRRISDVPLGVLLSGGLDSGSVAAALALQAGSGVASFTVRFKEPEYDEGPLARQIVDRYRLDPHELTLSAEQLFDGLAQATWLNDEPLAHGNDPHIWRISEYAKPRVTVLLSGEGSDELLGGYVRYQPLRYPGLLHLARPTLSLAARTLGIRGRLQKFQRFLALGGVDRMVLFNSCDALPADLAAIGMRPTGLHPFRERVLKEAQALYPNEPFRQAMYCDQHTFLQSLLDRNDRMTMGASIECRVPFLDYRLVEGVAALPTAALVHGRRSKYLLRSACGARLPDDVIHGRKWGFGVPWAHYMRNMPTMRDAVLALPETAPVCDGPFDAGKLRKTIAAFMTGEDRHQLLIRQLLLIAMWHRAFFCGAPPQPVLAR